MNDICLVYLARKKDGQEPFKKFLTALGDHPPGVPHDFVIVFKGFSGKSDYEGWCKPAQRFSPRALEMPDRGFDLGAYRFAAETVANEWLCCVNTFSEPLAGGWLEKLLRAARHPGVGVAGASGSWESMYRNALLDYEDSRQSSMLARLRLRLRIGLCKATMPPFPNCHLRTNGFVMRRELLLRLWPKIVLFKRAAYLFENGRRGLTRRIEASGIQVLVVGRDGTAYRKQEWSASRTFRSGEQENLLIADNQTRQYQQADRVARERLRSLAWGD